VGQDAPEITPVCEYGIDEALQKARETSHAHHAARLQEYDSRTLRLEVLRLELDDAISSHETARFVDLKISGLETPRLWIDLTSYVIMEPTSRTYSYMVDRQDSSELLFETTKRADMHRFVIDYVAHRVIERERAATGQGQKTKPVNGEYSTAGLWLAWLSGFLLGVIALFVFGLWYVSNSPL